MELHLCLRRMDLMKEPVQALPLLGRDSSRTWRAFSRAAFTQYLTEAGAARSKTSWCAMVCRLPSHRVPDLISKITGIPSDAFLDVWGYNSLENCSVAKRFSRAAKRQCTRVEDVAYSLMGLFKINMPLLYGEGINAFRRLQEEILKEFDDNSILAWTVSNT